MDKVGFIFGLGHGHSAQFENLRQAAADLKLSDVEFIGLDPIKSGDRIGSMPRVPWSIRVRRNQMWHAKRGLEGRKWRALVIAGAQRGLLPYMKRTPSYLYTDLSTSNVEELAPWYSAKTSNLLSRALRAQFDRSLDRVTRGIFAMSGWCADAMVKDYDMAPGQVHVSLPGANLSNWSYTDRGGRGPGRNVRILMVGGQFKRKGGELLLQWARTTTAKNWELDFVAWPGELPPDVLEKLGNPQFMDRTSGSLAPELPNVRFHCGLQANSPQLLQLYADADIFCLPTFADGSSIASLEAMATGLPVIVSAVGGIPELVRDGETGLLIKGGSFEDMKTKLEGLVESEELRLRIGRAARASCEDYFNCGRQLREMIEVVDRGCSEG